METDEHYLCRRRPLRIVTEYGKPLLCYIKNSVTLVR
jgi:hypothetical protein